MAKKSTLNKKTFSKRNIIILVGLVGIFIAGTFFGAPLIEAVSHVAPQEQFKIPFEDPIVTLDSKLGDIIICTDPSSCIDPPDPYIEIPPITSDDPPIKQIIDEIDDGDEERIPILCTEENLESCQPLQIQVCPPLCGSNNIRISSLVTKTDSAGEVTFTTQRLDIPLSSFFVEDTTNIDYSKGFLEIRTKLFPSNPDLRVSGTALFDILINNKSALSQPADYQVNGKPCFIECAIPAIFCGDDDACSFIHFNIGSVNGIFVSTTGIKSPSFLFSIGKNIDKFDILQGVNVLEFVLLDVDIKLTQEVQCVTSPCDPVNVESFVANKLVLFTMDITRDPDLIIITDEEGGTSRVFPTDDRFTYTNSGDSLVDRGTCRTYYSRPSGTIELYDSENNLLKSSRLGASKCKVFTSIDIMLQRDQTYRLVHTSVGTTNDVSKSLFDIKFTTPISQKNLRFGCHWFAGFGVSCTYPNFDVTETIRIPIILCAVYNFSPCTR